MTEWPTTGSPPTISNFKNMHSYIKWWKRKRYDVKKSWHQMYLDHFIALMNTGNILSDYVDTQNLYQDLLNALTPN